MVFRILIIFPLLVPSLTHAKSFGGYQGDILLRNHDGGTITFNLLNLHPIIGQKINIWANGTDTPEIKEKREKEKYNAKQAKEMVADILKDAEQIVLRNLIGQQTNFLMVLNTHLF